ncbi:hypothetical protein TNCV_4473281 [Trichonephila clavipes]|uniref:Tc1-like transposase DDE domain-containing protein n=1 Tax=Trichonephila clavipes TaxID=2585209 RepID=A0A8X6VM07_TRICX|nr:hypothetical protein TNCV_4473281 [Trichonephila clavipes]
MDDNVRSHRAHPVDEFLESEDIRFAERIGGMTAIEWSMESGRRGFGASSGWRIFKVFDLAESLVTAL